ncbi:MAG: ribonuclease III [Candidatus Muiribacteriota bacterium]|jgi:ribonuclease-3
MENKSAVEALENKIGVDFSNKKLIEKALTHRSYEECGDNNETLEFLGDSVLSVIISEHIYKRFPGENEGFLAKLRAFLVRAEKLKEKADIIGLGKYIFIGKGEEKTGGRERASILSNALEAVIGAVYLDKGIDITAEFVLNLYNEDLKKENIDLNMFFDYKTQLQEYAQKKFRETPEYKVINQRGPDHRKIFEVEVKIHKNTYGYGSGYSKKEAEQIAAKQAYAKLIKPQEG